jgi:hypothetical protein
MDKEALIHAESNIKKDKTKQINYRVCLSVFECNWAGLLSPHLGGNLQSTYQQLFMLSA